MTIRIAILRFLQMTGDTHTAADLWSSLNTEFDVKLTSLSSTLKKMYDAGELERFEGIGPRGGYGYRVKR